MSQARPFHISYSDKEKPAEFGNFSHVSLHIKYVESFPFFLIPRNDFDNAHINENLPSEQWKRFSGSLSTNN